MLVKGKMTPSTPQSSTRLAVHSSFTGGRANGTAGKPAGGQDDVAHRFQAHGRMLHLEPQEIEAQGRRLRRHLDVVRR